MAIKLWQRKHGHLGPPGELIHAEPESRHFPVPFRNRIVRWSVDCFRQRFPPAPYADDSPEEIRGALNSLCHQLAEAYGRPLLVPIGDLPGPVASTSDYEAERQIPAHLARCTDFEVLDFIDGVFQLLAQTSEGYAGIDHKVAIHATSRLNAICEEEGVGYRWADGELIRFDDPVAHAEAVEPAMRLLSAGQFGHANAEFRRALECYRSGAWRDAITNANAAFESVLKVVTGKHNLTAGSLIAEARRQGVIPGYMQNSAENLGKVMNVVPAVRGQEGPHGLGAREEAADGALARFVLTTSAAFIVFIARDTS